MGQVGERLTGTVTLRAVAPNGGRATKGIMDIDGDLIDGQWTEVDQHVGVAPADIAIEHLPRR